MKENDISGLIVSACYRVHKTLGPGLLESAYTACLIFELQQLNLHFETQKAVPVIYNDVKLDCGYRLDLYVENMVIVEVKSIEALHDIHTAQLLTYLRLTNC